MLRILLLITIQIFAITTFGQNDSTKRRNILAIPYAYYTQETSWVGGIGGQYFFWKKDPTQKVSTVNANIAYTFNKQIIVDFSGRIFDKDQSLINFKFNWQKFPDRFYGIGPDASYNIYEKYTPIKFNTRFERLYYVRKDILFGPSLFFRADHLQKRSENSIDLLKKISGTEDFHLLGAGAVFMVERRNNLFYATKGSFLKLTLEGSPKITSTLGNMLFFESDYRKYFSISQKSAIAVQTLIRITAGDVPFQMMPTLGGQDELRGIRRGIYRDKCEWLQQVEYRFPIYKDLKAAAFGSVGSVGHTPAEILNSSVKSALGGGLRLKANKTNVHLRLDYAIDHEGQTGFYFTAIEAF